MPVQVDKENQTKIMSDYGESVFPNDAEMLIDLSGILASV